MDNLKALQRCQRHLNELRKLEQTDFASGLNLGILENRLNLEHILSEEERRLQAYILRNKLEINGD